MENIATRRDYLDRLPVTENGRIVFVKSEDIEWIESACNYSRVHAHARQHDMHETLTSLEGRLNPREFVEFTA